MQVVRREKPAIAMEFVNRWPPGPLRRPHASLIGQMSALLQVTRGASCDDILPSRVTAFGSRHEVVEGKVIHFAAILAREFVAKEDVESRERRVACRLHKSLEGDDAWQPEFKRRAADDPVVL